jgi:hypothetical protein
MAMVTIVQATPTDQGPKPIVQRRKGPHHPHLWLTKLTSLPWAFAGLKNGEGLVGILRRAIAASSYFQIPSHWQKKSDFHVKKIHFTEFMNGVENCSLTCGSKLRESLLTGQGNDPP